MIRQFGVNFVPMCFVQGNKNISGLNMIYTLLLSLKTTIRLIQKYFFNFVIRPKIQVDPAHYSSVLDTKIPKNYNTCAVRLLWKKMSDTRKSSCVRKPECYFIVFS